ncbi:dTDP-4-amino-4,6-dideoxygalactose transaminase [Dethiosulfatibacter aminovorans DSM 17477]|uniref:dTDP-4-amino-4,6-dideoxygalactose transaminase n=1 Tax=Dethiosulfatibacter aminovorans DSM 17477 TaxID=1121476 RepID=A0A1M6BJE8_9FIRM|nr:DegT/DnrJ/EryC1/StrS family aminotransferase [Dethiosulfatibacter aminovorans]SHI48708.1 dTDP-4-amino-4,6-dideoxygalactose transaminase [Dethiosulfatibacter aminovorans DSM 17477]
MKNGFENPIYVTKPLLPELEKINSRLEKIWKTGMLTNMGEQHRELEEKLSQYLACENITLFNNGTIALMAGLKALDLKGEVITTPFTFPATVQALEWNGLKPVFCDIDPVSMTMDAGKIEDLINENTSAILGVHVFDNICDVRKIDEISKKYNLKIVYDAAHSFGSIYEGVPVWEFGDMSMFSFHATKLFNTIEGGCIISKDAGITERLELMKSFGRDKDGKVADWGINGKLNEFQAAMGIEVLKLVAGEKEKRIGLAKIYNAILGDIEGIRVVTEACRSRSCQYLVVEIDEEKFGKSRDMVFEALNSSNVFPRKYFHPLCSDTDWYRMDYSNKELKHAQSASERVLALPFYGGLSEENVEKICNIILNC